MFNPQQLPPWMLQAMMGGGGNLGMMQMPGAAASGMGQQMMQNAQMMPQFYDWANNPGQTPFSGGEAQPQQPSIPPWLLQLLQGRMGGGMY